MCEHYGHGLETECKWSDGYEAAKAESRMRDEALSQDLAAAHGALDEAIEALWERDVARPEVAALTDEYAIVHDGDPKMDGGHEHRVIGRFTTLEQVKAQMPGVIARSKWAPKSNLRIEHRRVTEWTVVEEYGDV